MHNWTYFSNCTSGRTKILQGNTKHMKLYCGKVLGQMELRNILFQRVQLLDESCQICQIRPLCTIWYIFGAICWNFNVIQVRLETRHLKFSNHIW